MFVSAFWFGVVATLAAEFLIAATHVIVADARDSKSKGKEDEPDERS